MDRFSEETNVDPSLGRRPQLADGMENSSVFPPEGL